ncbi:hypothetical protein [uncultured Mailhella sp.]|uniref:hypothetical protein n=1 Tax=uncultured Mailhella sp. TaxID=1981031 RepID=UPI003208E813
MSRKKAHISYKNDVAAMKQRGKKHRKKKGNDAKSKRRARPFAQALQRKDNRSSALRAPPPASAKQEMAAEYKKPAEAGFVRHTRRYSATGS